MRLYRTGDKLWAPHRTHSTASRRKYAPIVENAISNDNKMISASIKILVWLGQVPDSEILNISSPLMPPTHSLHLLLNEAQDTNSNSSQAERYSPPPRNPLASAHSGAAASLSRPNPPFTPDRTLWKQKRSCLVSCQPSVAQKESKSLRDVIAGVVHRPVSGPSSP